MDNDDSDREDSKQIDKESSQELEKETAESNSHADNGDSSIISQ